MWLPEHLKLCMCGAFVMARGLFTENGEPNEKYRAIQSLLRDKLSTRVSAKTDGAGRLAFRGFHGDYEISLTLTSGETSTVRATISADAPDIRLIMDESTVRLGQ